MKMPLWLWVYSLPRWMQPPFKQIAAIPLRLELVRVRWQAWKARRLLDRAGRLIRKHGGGNERR